MKNKSYVLWVLVGFVCLAGWIASGQVRSAGSARRAWEYKTILRSRGWQAARLAENENFSRPTDWAVFEDGKKLSASVDLLVRLNELGAEGWELVSDTPRSSFVGDGAAGFTSEEVWILKRPKP